MTGRRGQASWIEQASAKGFELARVCEMHANKREFPRHGSPLALDLKDLTIMWSKFLALIYTQPSTFYH